jgi:hypothetical protein
MEVVMGDRTPLERLFTKLWYAFLDGNGIDGTELGHLLEETGLVVWKEATKTDVAISNVDIEVGDPLLWLTDEGRRIVKAVLAKE